MLHRTHAVAVVAPLLAVALLACGSNASHTGTNTTGSTTVTLTAIAVSPSDVSVPAGLSARFTATGTYSDGSTKDLTSSVSWTAADATCATARTDAADAFDTHSTCTTTITAKDQATGVYGTSSLVVVSATLDDNAPLTLAPPDPTLLVGTTLQLGATAILSDDSVADIFFLDWQSSDPTIASVDGNGVVTAVKIGTVTITATKPGANNSGTTTVTVTNVPGVLSYLGLSPGSVVGGGTRIVTGTVALTSPAVADKAVALTSNDAAAVVPASITIPAGAISGTFQVTTLPVSQRTKVTITATTGDSGDPSKTATLNIRKAH